MMRDTRHETYFQPAFLICAGVLALAGSGMPIAIRKLGVHLEKKALPLKKPLDLLDERAFAPYKVVAKQKIENEQVVKELGTQDYVEWILEDPNAAEESAVGKCSLFITYYEHPDPRVVHVPDECYMGVGYQRLAFDSVRLRVTEGDKEKKLGAKYIVFASTGSSHWQPDTRFPVLYLFNVNGSYAGSREEARIALNKNIFSKYSYFSKVEWKFFNSRFGRVIYPSKQEAVIASEKLLAVILPVLEREHWPDWPVVDGE